MHRKLRIPSRTKRTRALSDNLIYRTDPFVTPPVRGCLSRSSHEKGKSIELRQLLSHSLRIRKRLRNPSMRRVSWLLPRNRLRNLHCYNGLIGVEFARTNSDGPVNSSVQFPLTPPSPLGERERQQPSSNFRSRPQFVHTQASELLSTLRSETATPVLRSSSATEGGEDGRLRRPRSGREGHLQAGAGQRKHNRLSFSIRSALNVCLR